MTEMALLRRLSDEVFHEAADATGVADQLANFLESLGDAERQSLAVALDKLAGASSEERSLLLDDIAFAWDFDNEAEFFRNISAVVRIASGSTE